MVLHVGRSPACRTRSARMSLYTHEPADQTTVFAISAPPWMPKRYEAGRGRNPTARKSALDGPQPAVFIVIPPVYNQRYGMGLRCVAG